MGLVAWRKIRPISTRDHDPARTSAACPPSAQVAEQPALFAADPDLAVLGGQHRAGAPCRRPRAAADAVLRPLDRHLSDPAALCLAASEAGLAGAARASADDAVSVVRRVRLQQCDLLLGPAIYRGAERTFDPVVGTAVCRAVVAGAVRHPPHGCAARRHHHFASRRPDHHPAWRFWRARQYQLQPRRPDVCELAGVVRIVFGADPAPPGDARAVADFIHHLLRRADAGAVLDLGIFDRRDAEVRRRSRWRRWAMP